jgi:hypothetical protein
VHQEAEEALKKAHELCQEALEIIGARTGDVPEVTGKT